MRHEPPPAPIGPGALTVGEAIAEIDRLARECVEDSATTDSRVTDALWLIAEVLRRLAPVER